MTKRHCNTGILDAIVHMTPVPSTLLNELCTFLTTEMLDRNILRKSISGYVKPNDEKMLTFLMPLVLFQRKSYQSYGLFEPASITAVTR